MSIPALRTEHSNRSMQRRAVAAVITLVAPLVAAPLVSAPVATAQAARSSRQVHATTARYGMARPMTRPGEHRRARITAPTVPVVPSPFGVGINQSTGSVYVAGDGAVAVIDATSCNARVVTGCARTPISVPSGHGGIGITVDEATDTIYVANGGDDTVSVIDGSTCNATVTAGCASDHPTVPVGSLPSHVAVDQESHTLYVSNEGGTGPGGTVSMIDTSSCNGHTTVGCHETPSAAEVGTSPDGLVVDRDTHTLYVSNGADNTVSIIDTATCNARVSSGCRANPRVIRLASSPTGSVLDAATHTLFVPTLSTLQVPDAPGALSIINTARCNAIVATGCDQIPARVTTGSGPIDVAENPVTRRAYVVNIEDSDVTVIDIRHCNAISPDGCRRSSPSMDIGFTGGAAAVDPATDTIYASSQDEPTVTVLAGATCNQRRTTGCRHPAPTTPTGLGPAGSTLSHARDTLYVANQFADTVSVIDTHACNTRQQSGCRATWPTIPVGQFPNAVALDEPLDTLYVTNKDSKTVSVIDARTCNAHVHTGCQHTPAGTIAVSGGPSALAVDTSTHTVYVTNVNSDTVSVINAKTCNAHVHTGCGQTPTSVRTGKAPDGLLIDPTTHTLYVVNGGDDDVALVDTLRCNAIVSSECSAKLATVKVAAGRRFMAINPKTATLYVSARDTSSLAMIDTTRCNARTTTGCNAAPSVVHVGFLPYGVAVDPRSGYVLVGNVGDSTVSAFDGARCNATTTTGCGSIQPTVEAGGWPAILTVDDSSGTVYVSDNVDAAVSIVRIANLTARWPRRS